MFFFYPPFPYSEECAENEPSAEEIVEDWLPVRFVKGLLAQLHIGFIAAMFDRGHVLEDKRE
ncbi:MAG: hypothetical protein AAB343_03415 [Patescibacteria group bacterium]